jgi:hypothetical protein
MNGESDKPKNKPSRMRGVVVVMAVLTLLAVGTYLFVWPVSGLQMSKSWRCDIRGGKMIDTGCGIVGCHYECATAYFDGGKECSSSRDCRGKCLVFVSPLAPWGEGPPDGPGNCAEYTKLKNCSRAYEVFEDGSRKPAGSCTL